MNVFFVACKVKQRKINILSVVKYASFTKIFFYLGRKFIPRRFNIGIYKLDRRYAGFFLEFSVRSFCRYFSRLYAALGKLPTVVGSFDSASQKYLAVLIKDNSPRARPEMLAHRFSPLLFVRFGIQSQSFYQI